MQFSFWISEYMMGKFCLRLTSVLFIFFIAAATQAQSLIPELSFKNPKLKTGKGCAGDGLDGAVYIFENVGWGMDALITILGRSGPSVTLSEVDLKGPDQDSVNGTGYDNAWQPRVKYGDGTAPAHKTWWMEFRVSFVNHNDHNVLMPVNQFFVSGLDIDGDGNQLHEFQSYYQIRSFSLQRESAIFASSIHGSESDPFLKGKRYDGTTKDYPGISVEAEDAMVSNFYKDSGIMILRLGAETGFSGTKSSDRMYGLLFKSLTYDIPLKKKLQGNLIALNCNKEPKQFE
jgi:hypothetical protein